MAALAKAVYENVAETADELSFKQGELLHVLEFDINGLEGWWLCSLRGKTGIVPGNRLKPVNNNGFDNHNTDINNSEKGNSEQQSGGVITPRKLGDVFLYDSPTMHDFNRNQSTDYDQPRPAAVTMDIKQQQLVDQMQNKLKLDHIHAIESLYDLPGAKKNPALMSVAFPESNRSSSISMSSVLSSISGTPSSSGSAPPSGRSSFDVTHDVYDIPPSSKNGRSNKVQKSKSSDFLDAMETYDSPVRSALGNFMDSEPLYHTPKPSEPVVIDEGGDYCEIRDGATPTHGKLAPSPFGFSGNRPSLGYVQNETYDSPSSLPVRNKTSYTVPLQTESTNISDKQDQIPDLAHKELRLSVSSAVSTMNTHQQDLCKSCEKLISYAVTGWRKRDNLEPKLFEVKIQCIAVKTALEEFHEFGYGALANSTGLSDKRVYFTLKGLYEPLSTRLEKISSCMKGLNDIKWDIAKLSMETLESDAVSDDLNQIITICGDLPALGRNFAVYVISNATPLFELYQLFPSTPSSVQSGKRDVTPPRYISTGSVTVPKPSTQLDRPVVKDKPKPPVLKPKPKFSSSSSRDDSIKSPPILPKPQILKGAPLKPDDDGTYDTLKRPESEDNTKNNPVFTPKKITAAKLQSFDDGNKDYDNAETKYRLSQLEGYADEQKEEQLDYDYAALTPDMHSKSLQYKYEHETDEVKPGSLVTPEKQALRSEQNIPGSSTNTHVSANLSDYDTPQSNRTTAAPSDLYDSPSSRIRSNTPSNVQEIYDSPAHRNFDCYDSPNRPSVISSAKSDTNIRLSSELDMSGQINHLNVPGIRTSGLSPKFKEKLEKLQTESEIPVLKQRDSQVSVSSDLSTRQTSDVTRLSSDVATPTRGSLGVPALSDSDKQVLRFYASQLESHITVLVSAMDELFHAVDYNQPPKVFIAHSKFVVLAAHKLVYIGDTICRNISSERVRGDVMSWSNQLCDALKGTVNATKQAALQYPNVQATQEMVNRIVNVSQITNNLKTAITRNI